MKFLEWFHLLCCCCVPFVLLWTMGWKWWQNDLSSALHILSHIQRICWKLKRNFELGISYSCANNVNHWNRSRSRQYDPSHATLKSFCNQELNDNKFCEYAKDFIITSRGNIWYCNEGRSKSILHGRQEINPKILWASHFPTTNPPLCPCV